MSNAVGLTIWFVARDVDCVTSGLPAGKDFSAVVQILNSAVTANPPCFLRCIACSPTAQRASLLVLVAPVALGAALPPIAAPTPGPPFLPQRHSLNTLVRPKP